MDRLDKLSVVFILVFITSLAVVSAEYRKESANDIKHASTQSTNSTAGLPGDQMKILKNLIDTGNFPKAEPLLNELIGKYPYDGGPHMLMGDLMMRKQDALSALYHYREAVDLNPDYLDKKTPLFQGHKIKIAVTEARAKIDEIIAAKPDDLKAKETKRTMYYLMKKLAGSCG